METKLFENVKKLSTHEHIGAFVPLGFTNKNPKGTVVDQIRGKKLNKKVFWYHIIFSPYFSGLLYSVGAKYPKEPVKDHVSEFKKLMPQLQKIRNSGQYICVNKGLKECHGISIDDIIKEPKKVNLLNEKIEEFYKKGFHLALSNKLNDFNVTKVLKPVHLNYFFNQIDSMDEYKIEKSICEPILRVDDLFGYETDNSLLSFEHLNHIFNINTKDFVGLEELLEQAFIFISNNKIKSLKQLQAYHRTLYFEDVKKDEAYKAWKEKDTDVKAKKVVQDYIMHRICKFAQKEALPYQIHTGMTNMIDSNPALLKNCIRKYDNIPFVLLHGYPYIHETNYIARNYKNVYVDIAWLALQSRKILEDALLNYVEYLPSNKLMISCDATTIEEFAGASKEHEIVLNKVFKSCIKEGIMNQEHAKKLANSYYYDNAINTYKLK